MQKEFLTRQEVANLLGISTRTVARRVKSGVIQVVRHKGNYRYPIHQFEDIKQEDTDTTKLLIKTLQEQLIQKDIQIRNMQEDTKLKTLEEQLHQKDDQIRDLSQKLGIEQVKTMSKGDKKMMQKQMLLPNYTEQQVKPKPNKKSFLERVFKNRS